MSGVPPFALQLDKAGLKRWLLGVLGAAIFVGSLCVFFCGTLALAAPGWLPEGALQELQSYDDQGNALRFLDRLLLVSALIIMLLGGGVCWRLWRHLQATRRHLAKAEADRHALSWVLEQSQTGFLLPPGQDTPQHIHENDRSQFLWRDFLDPTALKIPAHRLPDPGTALPLRSACQFGHLVPANSVRPLHHLYQILTDPQRAQLDTALTELQTTGQAFDLSFDLEALTADSRRPEDQTVSAGHRLHLQGRCTQLDHNGATATHIRTSPKLGQTLYLLTLSRDPFTAPNERLQEDLQHLAGENRSFARLLDHLPLPIWMRDAEGRLIYWNKLYSDITSSDVVGKEIFDSPLASRVRTLERPLSESHHLAHEGAFHLYDFTEMPLPTLPFAPTQQDLSFKAKKSLQNTAKQQKVSSRAASMATDAKASGLGRAAQLGFGFDLTALENSQQELSRHLAAHNELLENLTTPIEIYGPDKRLKFFNSAFQKMARLTTADETKWLKNEPLMSEMLEMLRERRRLPEYADFPAFKKSRSKLFTNIIEPLEDLLHLPDGSTWRMWMAPHPLGGLIFTYENVTDKLSLERRYNTLAAVREETINHLYEAVAVFGSDGRLKFHNPVYRDLWKLTPMMLSHEPHITDIIANTQHFFDRNSNWPDYKDWAVNRVADPMVETGRFERSDSAVIDYACIPLPDGGVMFSFLDVSDSIKAQKDLQERNNALQRADRLRNEFVANLSVELHTPLNQLVGLANMLANQLFGTLSAEQYECAGKILDSANKLEGMIKDILDLATIEGGQMEIHPKRFYINDLLQSLVSLCSERARHGEIEVLLECPSDNLPMDADDRLLKQAFYKLLVNALKYTPPGGKVTLEAKSYRCKDRDQPCSSPLQTVSGLDIPCIAISVRDTGPGFHDNDLRRLSGEETQLIPTSLAGSALHNPKQTALFSDPLPLFRHLEEDDDPEALNEVERALEKAVADLTVPSDQDMHAFGVSSPSHDFIPRSSRHPKSMGEEDKETGQNNIGLTLARRFVELHGGWLEVSSDREGSCVTCILPRHCVALDVHPAYKKSFPNQGQNRVIEIKDVLEQKSEKAAQSF